jgi:hypothetical protein
MNQPHQHDPCHATWVGRKVGRYWGGDGGSGVEVVVEVVGGSGKRKHTPLGRMARATNSMGLIRTVRTETDGTC